MKIDEDTQIGQIVADDYRTASIFDAYAIDYCCNGNRSLKEACSALKLEPEELIIEINAISGMQSNLNSDYRNWPLDKLVGHIEKVHHKYVEDKSIEIERLLNKICQVHGSAHPELFTIKELFTETSHELARHMKKEELILFPYILRMVKAFNNQIDLTSPPFGSINNPITQMEHDHDTEGERFRKIEALTNHYRVPADACATYTATFAMLHEFEKDLHLHIHLENNILFPKSIELEKELSRNE